MAPHANEDSYDMNGSSRPSNGVNGSAAPAHQQTRHRNVSPHLRASDVDSVHDLLCCGFGPASLAIAVAIHDAMEAGTLKTAPNVMFLEKQSRFAWHAGMLLPGAKMQISFVKDLATLRDPRSHFTFLNYLHQNGRLVDFTNLSTFLPARREYEDYLRWCASHFDEAVRYNSEVVSVSPQIDENGVKVFTVVERNEKTGATSTHRARNVIVAIGGQASIPKSLPASSPRVIHSSQYAYMMPQMMKDRNAPVRVAVIGGGQSAAEIFNNVQELYPNSKTYLVMKSEFLKPSDDSPFVNSIFNPEFVDPLYSKSSSYRQTLIQEAKQTNYGVVRLELIEHLYERMYEQRREIGVDETAWPHRILGGRRVLYAEDGKGSLRLKIRQAPPGEAHLEADGLVDSENEDSIAALQSEQGDETLDVDLIVAATGYRRNAHVDMLKEAWNLLPEVHDGPVNERRFDQWAVKTKDGERRVMAVSRDYKVKFANGKVAPGSGVWLQGCCEGTHGVSLPCLALPASS